MRKILLTSVGVAALAVSANATDFTLSGTSKLQIADDGNTSVSNTINVGVSKTFDNANYVNWMRIFLVMLITYWMNFGGSMIIFWSVMTF